MEKNKLWKRYLLFTASLFITAVCVAITRKAELGISPVSSIPNVVSLKYTSISLGKWMMLWNCLLIGGQILLLRKKFRPVQLIQVPISFLFGYFTDAAVWLISFVSVHTYLQRLALDLFGIAVGSFGIALAVIANVVMNSGEAFIKALADTIGKDFGTVKTGFDIFCVLVSVIFSLLFFDGHVVGTGEGTIISAFCSGLGVKVFLRYLEKPVNRLLA